jgi:DNA ligase (NAD+)
MAITFINNKARSAFESYITNANLGLPTSCPECGADIEIQENGQVRCVNPNCKKKVLHKYINFFKTLEIDSAGEAFCSAAADEGNTIKFLIDKGLVDPDAYVRFAGGTNGNKVAASLKAKLSESISAAKYFSLFDLEGFGEKKLDKIEEILKSMLDGAEPTVKEIIEVEGWAIQSALDFLEAFKANKQDIMQCKDFFNIGSAVVTGGKLEGKSFCFTGKAEAIDGGRKACEKLVKDNGGIVASGVSKTLSYLVTDDTESGSSKNVKAKQLGIPVISSFQFADMLK